MNRWPLAALAVLLGTTPAFAAPATPGRTPPPPASAAAPSSLVDVVRQVKPATVLIEVLTPSGMGWGSGFVVARDGHLVTNAHVVENAQRVTVYLKNSEKVSARVLAVQEADDLALLKVEPPAPLYTVALGEDQLGEGVEVCVTGYPQPPVMFRAGLSLDSSTVHGILSGRRTIEGGFFSGQVLNQMDAPLVGGNSGGPVYLAEDGKVVGVAVSSFDGTPINFAVPVSKVKQMLVDAGVIPEVRLAAGEEDALVAPGKLSALNVVPENKVLHDLFGAHAGLPNLTLDDQESLMLLNQSFGFPSIVSAPLDGDSRVLMAAANGTVYSYDLKDRRLRSLAEAEEPFHFPGVSSGDLVCFSSGQLDFSKRVNAGGGVMNAVLGFGGVEIQEIDGGGSLLAVNRRTGNLEWSAPGSFPGAPVVGGGRVFVGGLGSLASHDLATGREVWRVRPDYSGGDRLWYSAGTPLEDTLIALVVPVRVLGTAFFGRDEARLVGFDPATGKEKWKAEIATVNDHRYPLSGRVLVQPNSALVVCGDRISSHSTGNGAVQWKFTTRPNPKENGADKLGPYFAPELAAGSGLVYAGCDDKALYALSEKDGSVVWKAPTRGRVGVPALSGGTVYVGSRDKYLYAFDARTGALQWKYYCQAPVSARPLVKDGFVYCGTDAGTLLAVRRPVR